MRRLPLRSALLTLLLLVVLHGNTRVADALHVTGTFDTSDFFKFITRFGIQSTDVHNKAGTQGFIYGNVSLVRTNDFDASNRSSSSSGGSEEPLPAGSLVMLTVMDYNYFIDYYNKRRVLPRSLACSMMFANIQAIAYFFECNEKGTEDFIRRVPCASHRLCADEDNARNVLTGFQFTYKIEDLNQARFWYISLVACTRDTQTCQWKHLADYYVGYDTSSSSSSSFSSSSATTSPAADNGSNTTLWSSSSSSSSSTQRASSTPDYAHRVAPSYTIAYDIWLVNGNPIERGVTNRFEHQFTYELHDVFEIYMGSFVIYFLLLPLIVYRTRRHFHYLYLQLLVYVSVELTCRLLSLVHNLTFAYDGAGVPLFQSLSDLLEAIASSVLMLILISVAKGWTIRSARLRTTRKFYMFGALLQIVLVTSHMVSLSTIDPVFNTNSYETVAGFVELGVRFVCMIWFLIELKETFDHLESAAARNTRLASQSEEADDNDNDSTDSVDDTDEDEIERDGKRYASLAMAHAACTSDPDNARSAKRRHHDIVAGDGSLTKSERLRKYQNFYLHYGACALVWFIYLPILVFITSFVSELFRLRLVLSIRYFVNFISVVVLLYIMWSPKTPLRLPGKREKVKLELVSLHYAAEINELDDNDEAPFAGDVRSHGVGTAALASAALAAANDDDDEEMIFSAGVSKQRLLAAAET